jgi:hypothetical protein
MASSSAGLVVGEMTVGISPADYGELRLAVQKLETQSLAMKVAERLGMPIDALMRRLPPATQQAVHGAVNKALGQCLRVALMPGSQTGLQGGPGVGPGQYLASGVFVPPSAPAKRLHTATVALSGAVGGFFGLPGLLVELPVTTTVMLHSIVEIARSQGEDLRDPASALACLEVFALGPDRMHKDALESAYYVSRAALAQATREASAFLVQKTAAKEGAPALVSFLGKVAARFGIEVSEKVAAEIIPIAGAAGGATLNVLFSRHFQALAEGHFTVRRLERKYGAEAVRLGYERVRLALGA